MDLVAFGVQLLAWLSLLLVVVFCIALPLLAAGRFSASAPVNQTLDCPDGHVSLTATLLPGTLQEVGVAQNKLDLKAVGKLFFRDPLAGLQEAVALAGTSPLTKSMLEKNALAEYAPEYVQTFIHGLGSGDRLGIAIIELDGITLSVRYVFLGPAVELSNDKRRYCARPKAGFLNALILDGPQ